MKRLAITLALLALPVASTFAADVAAGKATFNTKCKACHGAEGAGGVMDQASIAGASEAATKAAVASGKGKMKAVPTVSGADLDNVAAYVASLKK